MTDQFTQRRTEVLDAAREIAEKARLENRGLTAAEQSQVDSALAEARELSGRLAADAKSAALLGQLDAMAAGRDGAMTHNGAPAPLLGLPGDGMRLSFGKAMATAAAAKIMPPGYAQKAVAPSGSVVTPQSFEPDVVRLGQQAAGLLSVLPVTVQASPQFAYLRQTTRTNLAAIVPEGSVKPTSVYSVVLIEDVLDVLAHLSEAVPRLWLADTPQLQQFLTNELTYGLGQAVESRVIADVAATSGIQVRSFSTSVLETLRKSVTLVEVNGGVSAAAIVLHPLDFEAIELALLTTPAVEHMS
jgi:HK97 family phage major capsid protein